MLKYFKRTVFLIFVLGFISCNTTDSNSDGIPTSVEGLWKSKVVNGINDPNEDFIMSLDLKQNGNSLSGNLIVEFVSSNETDTFKILDGEYNPPNLTMTAETDATNKKTQSLSCVVQDENTMECSLPTDKNITVTLTKQ